MAPARGAAEDGDGASHRRGRRARQGGGGARRLARGAGRPFRPLWLGDVGAAAGDRAGPGRRADCHHRRPHDRRGGRGQGSEGRRSVRHGRWRPGRRVRRPAGADQGHDHRRGGYRRPALGERRLRARQCRADQRISHPGHGPARPHGAGILDRSVQGICDQVACALPPRLRRFGLREDDPIGRAGAAAPRHDTARGAALPERRHLEVLSLRRRQLSLSERRAPSQRHPNLKLILDHLGRPRGDTSPSERWANLADVLALAKYTNLAVKATGAPSYADQPYPFRDIHDNLRRLYDAFGPARWFWGTDITSMPCPWRPCVTLFTEELPWLKGRDLELVMGGAICDWLGWKR